MRRKVRRIEINENKRRVLVNHLFTLEEQYYKLVEIENDLISFKDSFDEIFDIEKIRDHNLSLRDKLNRRTMPTEQLCKVLNSELVSL